MRRPITVLSLSAVVASLTAFLWVRSFAQDANMESKSPPHTKPPRDELEKRLSPMEFRVTQEDATEPPFKNEFWDNKRAGIYVDVVTGEPLFASLHKYDSGTGWPSFWQPLVPENVVEKRDRTLWVTRTEVRSRHADSHLGHVFDDGPPPTGRRYCINSAALRFIPVERLRTEGYASFVALFDNTIWKVD